MTQFKRLFFFGFVGGAAALVNLLVVWILVDRIFFLSPLKANVIGFLLAFCVSYTGHSKLTFNDSPHRARHAAPRFFIIAALSFLCNEGMYYLLLRFTPVYYLEALFLVLILVSIFTYIMGRLWAFRER